MTTADAVRRVGLALPRTYEFFTGGRYKLKVRQIVYVGFSKDESAMGFGYPRAARDSLVESAPDTFFLPTGGDLRYQWVCAHLDRARRDRDARAGHRRVADVHAADAARPARDRTAHRGRLERDGLPEAWDELRPLLHPYLHFTDGATTLRGRNQVLRHLADHPTPRPPTDVEVRDGQVYRWIR